MESIGFAFNDLYFVIDPFKFSGVNGVITVIEDTVAISLQRFDKSIH